MHQPKVIAEVLGGIILGVLLESTSIRAMHFLTDTITRPNSFWPYTRIHRTHFPFGITFVSQPRRKHRTLPVPLSRRSRNRHRSDQEKCSPFHHRCSRRYGLTFRHWSGNGACGVQGIYQPWNCFHPLHAVHWRGIFDYCFPCPLPHSNGAKAPWHDCWDRRPFGWCWEWYRYVFIEFLRQSPFPHEILVGWVLLALSVALVNASNGLSVFYILFACVGWTLFLMLPVKMALHWFARKTGSSMSFDGPF